MSFFASKPGSEKLLQNVNTTGPYLESKLKHLGDKHRLIGDIQGCGLFWGLDMVSDPVNKTPLSKAKMRHLGSLIVEQGVITGISGRYDQILKLRPPLPFSKQNADTAVAAIDAALEQMNT